MCRYAMSGPYKSHFACFTCRKAFKQPPIEDHLDSHGLGYVYKQLQTLRYNTKALQRCEKQLGHCLTDLENEFQSVTHRCSECGDPMIDMGLDFKPPKQSDAKAWKRLQGMYRVGHAFQTCGCNGPGWIPQSTSDYRSYLVSMKKQYEEQVKQIQKNHNLSPEAKQAAAEYWTVRISAIETEQKNVG